jgi:hypothetical protein
MEGWITVSQLKNLTEFLDKFCGTVSPEYRYGYLFFDKGLKVFATDGHAKMVMNFTREFLPFDGVCSIPIQYLKGILRGYKNKSDDLLKLSIEDNYLFFEFEEMRMNMEINKENKSIDIEKNFKILSSVSLKRFLKSLDFVSAAANEGEYIQFVSSEDKNYIVYSSPFFQSRSVIDDGFNGFDFAMTFETCRHLVKSLSLLKNEATVHFGKDGDNVFMYLPGVVINISLFDYENHYFHKKKNDFLECVDFDLSFIKKSLDKMYVAFKQNNNVVFLLTPKESYLYKEEEHSKISWKIPVNTKNQYLINLNVRKVRSLFTRMSEKCVLNFSKDEMVIVDKKNNIASFKVKEYKIINS